MRVVPDKIKEKRGTLEKSRQTENSMEGNVETIEEIPEAPKHFNKKAKQEWEKVTESLKELDILNDIDLALLQTYCFNVGLMDKCEKKLEEQDYVVIEVNGRGKEYTTKNKWISIYNEATDRVVKIATQFGFSPTSRVKISVPSKDKDPYLD